LRDDEIESSKPHVGSLDLPMLDAECLTGGSEGVPAIGQGKGNGLEIPEVAGERIVLNWLSSLGTFGDPECMIEVLRQQNKLLTAVVRQPARDQ
jgi:hypothetical protein